MPVTYRYTALCIACTPTRSYKYKRHNINTFLQSAELTWFHCIYKPVVHLYKSRGRYVPGYVFLTAKARSNCLMIFPSLFAFSIHQCQASPGWQVFKVLVAEAEKAASFPMYDISRTTDNISIQRTLLLPSGTLKLLTKPDPKPCLCGPCFSNLCWSFLPCSQPSQRGQMCPICYRTGNPQGKPWWQQWVPFWLPLRKWPWPWWPVTNTLFLPEGYNFRWRSTAGLLADILLCDRTLKVPLRILHQGKSI